MATSVTIHVTYNLAEEQALLFSPEMRHALLEIGDRIATDARSHAPRRSGGGAASIHAEAVTGPDGWEVAVSWDRSHYYMGFQETRRPFLRPAVDDQRA